MDDVGTRDKHIETGGCENGESPPTGYNMRGCYLHDLCLSSSKFL